MKEKADKELAKAKPALEDAEKAVNELNKDDITELKSVKGTPIPVVKMTLDCVLIYFGQKNLEWSNAQKVLADMQFLKKLREYDRESIPDAILRKVKPIIE